MPSRARASAPPGGAPAVPPPEPVPPGDDRRVRALLALAIIPAAVALAYANTLRSSFHFDDVPRILENARLRDLASFWPPLGSRDLGDLSFALNLRYGGLDPLGFHAVNLCIHACNALLVAWLAATTLRTPALRDREAGPLLRPWLPLAAGLLFATHPLQTQAVTYVVQRFASLATLFYLLAVLLYARARRAAEAGRAAWLRAAALHALSAACAVAAMRTKEIGVTLPAVVAGYELLFFRGGPRRLLLVLPACGAALLVPLGFASTGQGLADVLADPGALVETREISRADYLLTQARVVATYLRLLVLPVGQNLDHDVRLSRSVLEPSVLLSLALLASLAAGALALLVRARREGRAAGVLVFAGVAWFFVTASVESSVIPIRDVMAEHRVYLPLAGAAIALATALLAAVERLPAPRAAGVRCALALTVTGAALAAATHARNRVWRDDVTLWSDVVAKSPEKARPRNNLAVGLLRAGRTEEAIRAYREALRLAPGYADAHAGLGVALRSAGRGLGEAMGEFALAVRLDPGNAAAHANLGRAYQEAGALEASVAALREAIRLRPGFAQAHVNLAVSLGMLGRRAEAMAACREALRLDPGRADAHYYLGLALQEGGRPDLAAAEYREALRLDPGLVEARANLGQLAAPGAPAR